VSLIVEKSMSRGWLSNTYLIADRPGGHAVLVDTGGPTAPILAAIEEYRVRVTHVLCTHHHIDHVQHNELYARRFGCPICGHASERSLFGDLDRELAHDEELVTGDLRIRPLHIPGHTLGQLAFLVNDEAVFTGDTLFRRAVGGTRNSGHTTFEDIQHSVLEVLMRLPGDTVVYPGHTDSTTIAEEWAENPFIRMWRGLDAAAEQRCEALDRPATLLLRARDYDGGFKCQVRFDEGAELAIVPGSRVKPG